MINATTIPTKVETLARIARRELLIETLEARRRDRLDFHDVSVVGVRKALEAAYAAGQASVGTGRSPSGSPPPDATNNNV